MANVRVVDNNVIVALRDELSMSFTEIGKYFDMSDESVRKRYHATKKTKTTPSNKKGTGFWNQSTAIQAGQRFIKEYGRPPASKECEGNGRPKWMVHPTVVRGLFGSWSNYMLELGYFVERGKQPVKIA